MGYKVDNEGKEIVVDKKTEKARQAAFAQISKKAILVNLVRRQMSNMPFDVQLTQDIAKHLNVKNAEMLQVRKFLLDPARFSKIRSLINDALLMVWNNTRPWDNIGYRLLPMEYYDDFNETFSKIKDEFEEAVQEFVTGYDDYVKEAKDNLGKAFKKTDYPDKAQLTDMFTLEIETAQFPDIDDLRLNLSGPELMAMQKETTEKYQETLTNAMTELTNIIETDPKDVRVPKLFKTVEALNIINDVNIEMKLAELKDNLDIDVNEDDPKASMMVMDDITEDDLCDIDDEDDLDEITEML